MLLNISEPHDNHFVLGGFIDWSMSEHGTVSECIQGHRTGRLTFQDVNFHIFRNFHFPEI